MVEPRERKVYVGAGQLPQQAVNRVSEKLTFLVSSAKASIKKLDYKNFEAPPNTSFRRLRTPVKMKKMEFKHFNNNNPQLGSAFSK